MDYRSEREIWLFWKVAISPKLEKLYSPKLVCMHVTSIHTSMNFLSWFRLIKFFADHGPWLEREIWLFLKVAISLKLESPHPPKLVCMHVTSIHTCINFLSWFRSIKFFADYSPWSEREIIMAFFESSNFSETRESTSTKIGVHACDINPY